MNKINVISITQWPNDIGNGENFVEVIGVADDHVDHKVSGRNKISVMAADQK